MLQDLSALAPPFLVCAAFLIAVGAFLRHEMAAKRPLDDAGEQPGISADDEIPGSADQGGSGS